MIVPNLYVADVASSVAFYQRLGFRLTMSVSADQSFSADTLVDATVFAQMKWGEAEIMLQSADSLSEELPSQSGAAPSGTIYLRGYHPDEAPDGLTVIKPVATTWYGMREIYVSDPDGHILCLGAPDGPPPA
ncbi:MAG: hypothetical protein AAF401_11275 [Pseudomonadota bacterium]